MSKEGKRIKHNRHRKQKFKKERSVDEAKTEIANIIIDHY